MNLVLVHLGGPIPEHTRYCIEQARKFYDGPIWMVTEEGCVDESIKQRCIVTYVSTEQGSPFYSEALADFRSESWLGQYGWGGFWDVTMARLYALEDAMRLQSLTDVVHIENDVLIYHDPSTTQVPPGVIINTISDDYAGFAYMRVSDWKALHDTNQKMLAILREGKTVLEGRYRCMASEMLIAGEMLNRGDFMAFPTLPHPNAEYLYDGSAYGQWVGGTPNDPAGWAEEARYVGKAIIDGRISIRWTVDEMGRKVPEVLDCESGRAQRLANLHIHSKKLKEWMS